MKAFQAANTSSRVSARSICAALKSRCSGTRGPSGRRGLSSRSKRSPVLSRSATNCTSSGSSGCGRSGSRHRPRVRLAEDHHQLAAAQHVGGVHPHRVALAPVLVAGGVGRAADEVELLFHHRVEGAEDRREARGRLLEPLEHEGGGLDGGQAVLFGLLANAVVARLLGEELEPRQLREQRALLDHLLGVRPGAVHHHQRLWGRSQRVDVGGRLAGEEHRHPALAAQRLQRRVAHGGQPHVQLGVGQREVRHAAGADRHLRFAGVLNEDHPGLARHLGDGVAPTHRARPATTKADFPVLDGGDFHGWGPCARSSRRPQVGAHARRRRR